LLLLISLLLSKEKLLHLQTLMHESASIRDHPIQHQQHLAYFQSPHGLAPLHIIDHLSQHR